VGVGTTTGAGVAVGITVTVGGPETGPRIEPFLMVWGGEFDSHETSAKTRAADDTKKWWRLIRECVNED
jgi:hypothetical protein